MSQHLAEVIVIRLGREQRGLAKVSGPHGNIPLNDPVATGLLSVPLRYMHTPSEKLSLDDIEATIELVCAYCRRIRPETDFTPW